MTAESLAKIAAELAAIPADFDRDAHYAGCEPALREIFAAPIVGDGFVGDTLLDDEDEDEDA